VRNIQNFWNTFVFFSFFLFGTLETRSQSLVTMVRARARTTTSSQVRHGRHAATADDVDAVSDVEGTTEKKRAHNAFPGCKILVLTHLSSNY